MTVSAIAADVTTNTKTTTPYRLLAGRARVKSIPSGICRARLPRRDTAAKIKTVSLHPFAAIGRVSRSPPRVSTSLSFAHNYQASRALLRKAAVAATRDASIGNVNRRLISACVRACVRESVTRKDRASFHPFPLSSAPSPPFPDHQVRLAAARRRRAGRGAAVWMKMSRKGRRARRFP